MCTIQSHLFCGICAYKFYLYLYIQIMFNFYTIFIYTCLFFLVRSYNYDFTKTFTCTNFTNNKCYNWTNDGTIAMRTYSCFPQNSLVKTRFGNKQMKDLIVGDEVYAYNSETGQNEFSPIISWLHRDTEKRFNYTKIMNKEKNMQISSSNFHNIAIVEHEKIKYQFTKNLLHKNILSHQGKSCQVTELKNEILKGIYAPYVSSGNFYLVNEFNHEQLFLVHSFAHIKKPQLYESIFSYGIWITSIMNLNIQPDQKEYRHPLTIFLQRLFPQFIEKQIDNESYFDNPIYPAKPQQLYYSTYNNQQRQMRRQIQIFFTIGLTTDLLLLST